MSFLTSIIIILLVVVILTFMQLSTGVFSIFYHYSTAKHSRKKADDLSLDFKNDEIFDSASAENASAALKNLDELLKDNAYRKSINER